MRFFCSLSLLVLGSAIPMAAQSSCSPDALAKAARQVAALRHQLHGESVPESDPAVPQGIATLLQELKGALGDTANAVFACSNGAASPDQLEKTLADALHANVPTATGSVETRNRKDYGAYGSDLSVQVLQLFGRPKFVEVDFRYGIECGDDNLLMVYEAANDSASSAWTERLQWGAPGYTQVGDAIGDFVMLTPLTGSYKSPSWRFLVAHGQPGCTRGARASHFDLDLLSPTADPATPHVDWHFEHAYTEDRAVPRLVTTEDTIDFRISHEAKAAAKGTASAEVYRFHLTGDGHLEPAPAGEGDDSGGTPGDAKTPAATTNSPQ